MVVAGPRHKGAPLPCGRYLLVSLTVNEEGSKGLVVLRNKLGSRPRVLTLRCKTHPCVLYQTYATRGAMVAVAVKGLKRPFVCDSHWPMSKGIKYITTW